MSQALVGQTCRTRRSADRIPLRLPSPRTVPYCSHLGVIASPCGAGAAGAWQSRCALQALAVQPYWTDDQPPWIAAVAVRAAHADLAMTPQGREA